MTNNLRYFFALLGVSMRSAMSLRWVFIIRMLAMALNNALWLIIWWIFFNRFETVRGWTSDYFFAMYGTIAIALGATAAFGNGIFFLTRKIDNGDLDTLLLQPKPIVLTIFGSRCEANGFGDILTGLILYAWLGLFSPANLLPTLCVLTLVVLFDAAFLLATQSIGFWFRDMYDWAFQFFESYLVLGTIPGSVYTGVSRIFVCTVIPCAFVSLFPVEFLMERRLEMLLATVGGTLAFGALSLFLFYTGLRRYESGNRFAGGN